MRTCIQCNTLSPDTVSQCANCGADLSQHAATAAALADFRANPRVSRIRLITANDACPACRDAQGAFDKANVPDLPVSGCSHKHGCRCFYEPFLTEIYP